MSTYLQLCQQVARDSGTFTGVTVSSVVSQTGYLAAMIATVNEAWQNIQTMKTGWRWMWAELGTDAVTTAGNGTYTGAALGLSRFAEWILTHDNFTLYKQATGVSDESPLCPIDWDDFRRIYRRGTQTQNRPVHVSVDPADNLVLGPLPDDVYVIQGEYRKTPQTLAVNADVPEMPSRFHDLIAYRALRILHQRDEAPTQIILTSGGAERELESALMRDQLPRPRIGSSPLA